MSEVGRDARHIPKEATGVLGAVARGGDPSPGLRAVDLIGRATRIGGLRFGFSCL